MKPTSMFMVSESVTLPFGASADLWTRYLTRVET